MRDMKHAIDFVLGVAIPNKPTYCMSPKEHQELQCKVKQLMDKGMVRESVNP